mgnify:CR=1 FL=1
MRTSPYFRTIVLTLLAASSLVTPALAGPPLTDVNALERARQVRDAENQRRIEEKFTAEEQARRLRDQERMAEERRRYEEEEQGRIAAEQARVIAEQRKRKEAASSHLRAQDRKINKVLIMIDDYKAALRSGTTMSEEKIVADIADTIVYYMTSRDHFDNPQPGSLRSRVQTFMERAAQRYAVEIPRRPQDEGIYRGAYPEQQVEPLDPEGYNPLAAVYTQQSQERLEKIPTLERREALATILQVARIALAESVIDAESIANAQRSFWHRLGLLAENNGTAGVAMSLFSGTLGLSLATTGIIHIFQSAEHFSETGIAVGIVGLVIGAVTTAAPTLFMQSDTFTALVKRTEDRVVDAHRDVNREAIKALVSQEIMKQELFIDGVISESFGPVQTREILAELWGSAQTVAIATPAEACPAYLSPAELEVPAPIERQAKRTM